MAHGTSVSSITNIENVFERAGARYLSKVHPLEVMRIAPLANAVHDDQYNYALPSDFGHLIDLTPQSERESWDKAFRNPAGQFDVEKAIKNRTISIEGSDGVKIIRINWRNRKGLLLNAMDSLTDNGTWSAVGTTTNITVDTITKYSSDGSIRFNLAASGDGIKNTSMSPVDMTAEDNIADIFIPFFIKNSTELAKVTSATFRWGNDLTTNYWTGVAQTTQADGTDFKVGWNVIKIPWSTATETGTVDPTTIDSAQITFAITAAVADVRVDNIIFSIGRNFDIKYYSKFLFKSASTGLWISIPQSADDYVVIDTDTLPIFLFEVLKDMAQQVQGSDAAFDINYAREELKELFPAYKGAYPSQVKKQVAKYGNVPKRGRW